MEVILKVWGNYACFTRPEMKAERVSYDVITPSVARGILEAIYYKPEIRYIIDEIYIMKPIQFTAIRRNEVSEITSISTINNAIKAIKEGTLYLDTNDKRQQRSSIILKEVCYIIKAHFELTSKAEDTNEIKHYEIFKRRAKKGQCFMQPYLGCREFSANFEWLEEIQEKPIQETKDLSYMLYDIDFNHNMTPVFFRAQMENGIITMPPELSEVNKK